MSIYYILFFFFGAAVGSFLNVVALRYGTGKSFLTGRSSCSGCSNRLSWYELIPIISFLIQGGKCRACKSRLSLRYFVMEVVTGAVFLLVVKKQLQIASYGLSPLFLPARTTDVVQSGGLSTFYFLLIFSLLILISAYDLKHQIIPNSWSYFFAGLSLLYALINYKAQATSNIIAGVLFFLFFFSFWFFSRGTWMGLGDAKLSLGIGFMLGVGKGILALLLSFWAGAIIGIALLLIYGKQYTLKSKIPFGPFLVLGTFVSFLYGDYLIRAFLT